MLKMKVGIFWSQKHKVEEIFYFYFLFLGLKDHL